MLIGESVLEGHRASMSSHSAAGGVGGEVSEARGFFVRVGSLVAFGFEPVFCSSGSYIQVV